MERYRKPRDLKIIYVQKRENVKFKIDINSNFHVCTSNLVNTNMHTHTSPKPILIQNRSTLNVGIYKESSIFWMKTIP